MKIPKLIHQIWLGGKPIPPIFRAYMATWQKLHPDWFYHLWTEDTLPESRFPELVNRACHLSQKSNIHRYELMLDLGGIYVDTDFECCKNLEKLLDNVEVFVAESGRSFNDPRYCPAILGTRPNHPFFHFVVERLAFIDPTRSLSMGTQHLTKCVSAYPKTITKFTPEVFYPYGPHEMIAKCPRLASDFPEAHAVHHWSSVWAPTGFAKLT